MYVCMYVCMYVYIYIYTWLCIIVHVSQLLEPKDELFPILTSDLSTEAQSKPLGNGAYHLWIGDDWGDCCVIVLTSLTILTTLSTVTLYSTYTLAIGIVDAVNCKWYDIGSRMGFLLLTIGKYETLGLYWGDTPPSRSCFRSCARNMPKLKVCWVLGSSRGGGPSMLKASSSWKTSLWYCHILSHIVTYCHILSHIVTYCHILSHIVTYYTYAYGHLGIHFDPCPSFFGTTFSTSHFGVQGFLHISWRWKSDTGARMFSADMLWSFNGDDFCDLNFGIWVSSFN